MPSATAGPSRWTAISNRSAEAFRTAWWRQVGTLSAWFGRSYWRGMSFGDVWNELGVDLAVRDTYAWNVVGSDLRHRHQEPHRHYHVVRHVEAVLEILSLLQFDGAESRAAPMLGAAAFFHDAIYDPRRGDNEAASSLLARQQLDNVGVAEPEIETVCRVIEATASHQANGDEVTELFLDADLAILGSGAATYDWYAGAIRAEYGHMSDEAFRSGRASVLRGFLDRAEIFLTIPGRAQFEEQARSNLLQELATLGG